MKKNMIMMCLAALALLWCAPAVAGEQVVVFYNQALTASATATSEAVFIDELAAGTEIQYALRVESSDGGQVGLDYTLGVTPLGGNYLTPAEGGQLVTFQGNGEKIGRFTPGPGDKLKFIITEQAGHTARVYLTINY